ncbi:hypothetical protein [Variovorax sp. KK3]|uniref:hypothetical protein n=1 Tax=Variovorax sp. KK3 TaxID=1855728 RepID=UPI00097BF709|nr:hypothetical protein [Variovorax sp. KK3]
MKKSLLLIALVSTLGTTAPAMATVFMPQSGAPTSAPPPPTAAMPPGLYVHVLDGLISVSNSGGAQSFAAGQFGFTPSPMTPPVVVPQNPGLQFTPPPAFNAQAAPTASGTPAKSNGVDCEVR